MLLVGYNLKGCLCSIGVGFPFRERGVDIGMSEAPDGLLDNFEDGGRGVLVPLDDVFVLEVDPLAGLTRPVGVRGRELEPFIGVPNFFPEMLLCRLDVGVLPVVPTVRLGMRLGVAESSVLSSDCEEPYRLPCLEAGLLPGRLAGLDAGLEAGRLDGRLPPGVSVLLYDVLVFLTGVLNDVSLSLRLSGVPALRDVREALVVPIGTLRALLSRTLVIGPAEDICVRCRVEVGLGLDLNAVIDWLTPSANMKFSLSSIFVLPLARQGSFFRRNSSNATHPPPTRTITVDRRILTKRSF